MIGTRKQKFDTGMGETWWIGEVSAWDMQHFAGTVFFPLDGNKPDLPTDPIKARQFGRESIVLMAEMMAAAVYADETLTTRRFPLREDIPIDQAYEEAGRAIMKEHHLFLVVRCGTACLGLLTEGGKAQALAAAFRDAAGDPTSVHPQPAGGDVPEAAVGASPGTGG